MNLSNANRINDAAGVDSILPKEFNGTRFFDLSIVSRQNILDGVQAVSVWDSSVHESPYLNRITASTERIFLIVKVCLNISHPAKMEIILRKRIAINVYKKSLVSSTKNIFKRISRADMASNGTGITYEIVASIPKASEDIEDRESLALLAASDVDLTACDGESYIERYTKSVSALESLLTLDRLRQEVAIREQIAKRAKRALQLLQSNNHVSSTGYSLENNELRKTLSVPNMAQFVANQLSLSSQNGSTLSSNIASKMINNKTINNSSKIIGSNCCVNDSYLEPEQRSDSSFDLSYWASAAGRLRQKASSLFGSMTGLNQIYVTDIDIGEPSSSLSNNKLQKSGSTSNSSK